MHGDSEAIARYLHGLMHTHTYFYSPGPDSGTGGVIILINKQILHKAISDPTFLIFRPVRLVCLVAKFPFGQFSIRVFHDFDIYFENAERAQNTFKTQSANSIQDPLRKVLVAIGDFNRARGNARYYIVRPG